MSYVYIVIEDTGGVILGVYASEYMANKKASEAMEELKFNPRVNVYKWEIQQ